ncbi:MAG: bifunctional DNA primase/polymerase [Terracidiphilus sp.]
MNSSSNRDAALALASMGLHVFQANPDKTPMVSAWEQAATASPFAIQVKWDNAPDSLPGLPVGAHSLVVIDCDRKPNAPDGVEAFRALCAAHSIDLSGAFVVDTPSGGQHLYWRTETPYGNSRGSLPAGIDVRGLGGYVIAPGATLPDGRSYKLVQGSWDAIPALPDALAAFLRPKVDAGATQTTGCPVALKVTDRERAFAEAALADEVAKLTAMREGSGRNNALNTAALSLGTMDGWIDLNVVAAALWEASIANGYVAQDGEKAAKDTITSGLNGGMKKPRPLLSQDVPNIDISAMITNGIAACKQRQISKPAKEWPASLNADAYIGIAGDFIRLVAPQTEGDPCALLIAFLTVVGSLIGRGAYLPVGPTHHYGNLFSVIIAETSKGRKGTVMAEAKRFATMIDPTIAMRMLGGLSSGEGLIEAVRDARLEDVSSEDGKLPSSPVAQVPAPFSSSRFRKR